MTDSLQERSFNVTYKYPDFEVLDGEFLFNLMMPPVNESKFSSITIQLMPEQYHVGLSAQNFTFTGKGFDMYRLSLEQP